MLRTARRAASSPFIFVADEPAIDFVNTRPLRRGRRLELLNSYEDLVRWLQIGAPVSGSELRALRRAQETERALRAAKRLRGTLTRIVDRLADEREPRPRDVAEIARALERTPGHLTLERVDGRLEERFAPRPDGADGALFALARAGARLLRRAPGLRVRQCSADDCVLYFADRTRSRRRRWCDMRTCGNRSKVTAYRRRARRAAGRRQ